MPIHIASISSSSIKSTQFEYTFSIPSFLAAFSPDSIDLLATPFRKTLSIELKPGACLSSVFAPAPIKPTLILFVIKSPIKVKFLLFT